MQATLVAGSAGVPPAPSFYYVASTRKNPETRKHGVGFVTKCFAPLREVHHKDTKYTKLVFVQNSGRDKSRAPTKK